MTITLSKESTATLKTSRAAWVRDVWPVIDTLAKTAAWKQARTVDVVTCDGATVATCRPCGESILY